MAMPFHAHPHPRRGGALKVVGIGCGVLVAIAIIGGVVVALNARKMMAAGLRAGMIALVDQTPVSEDQKAQLRARVEQLTVDFREKRVTFEQLGMTMQNLAEGPLLSVGFMMGAERKYVIDAGLPEDETAAARRAFARVYRGLDGGELGASDVNDLLDPYTTRPDPNNPERREFRDITAEERAALIESLTAKADEFDIPDEDFEIQLIDILNEAIADATGAPPPG
jgi:hypothetical protein